MSAAVSYVAASGEDRVTGESLVLRTDHEDHLTIEVWAFSRD
jgi:hypothetical protein